MEDTEWYWCLDHNAAEPATSSCPPGQRWGPYPTKEAAEHWRERVEARNDAWAQAQQSSENLKQAISGDIQSQMNRYDQAAIDIMKTSLSAKGYVFRDLVAEFVASDAFRSAPALPITE